MKIRVYQLAKELGVPSKQLVEELKNLEWILFHISQQ